MRAAAASAQRGVLQKSPGRRSVRYELGASGAAPAPAPSPAAGLDRSPVASGTPARQARLDRLLRLLDDGQEHHVQDLARELGLGRVVVTRYRTELIAAGRVVATAPPRDRRRRYRKA